MTEFLPKGYYALERAVLLLARKLDQELWDHAKMTLAEVNEYERLGETAHYAGLRKRLINIEIENDLRDRRTFELKDDSIKRRFISYHESQKLIRQALHAGELRSWSQSTRTGERSELPAESWAQENAITWFDDGRAYILTGGTRRTQFRLGVPGLPGALEEPDGFMATILIDQESFSSWCYSSNDSKRDIEAREQDKGGRPPEFDWDAIKAFTLDQVREHGRPGKGNMKFPTKSQLVEMVLNEWASKKSIDLGVSTVRRYVRGWLLES
jgi:hypothetical protein